MAGNFYAHSMFPYGAGDHHQPSQHPPPHQTPHPQGNWANGQIGYLGYGNGPEPHAGQPYMHEPMYAYNNYSSFFSNAHQQQPHPHHGAPPQPMGEPYWTNANQMQSLESGMNTITIDPNKQHSVQQLENNGIKTYSSLNNDKSNYTTNSKSKHMSWATIAGLQPKTPPKSFKSKLATTMLAAATKHVPPPMPPPPPIKLSFDDDCDEPSSAQPNAWISKKEKSLPDNASAHADEQKNAVHGLEQLSLQSSTQVDERKSSDLRNEFKEENTQSASSIHNPQSSAASTYSNPSNRGRHHYEKSHLDRNQHNLEGGFDKKLENEGRFDRNESDNHYNGSHFSSNRSSLNNSYNSHRSRDDHQQISTRPVRIIERPKRNQRGEPREFNRKDSFEVQRNGIREGHRDFRDEHRDFRDTRRGSRDTMRDSRNSQRDIKENQRNPREIPRDPREIQRDSRDNQRDSREPQRDAREIQRDLRENPRKVRDIQRDSRDVQRNPRENQRDLRENQRDSNRGNERWESRESRREWNGSSQQRDNREMRDFGDLRDPRRDGNSTRENRNSNREHTENFRANHHDNYNNGNNNHGFNRGGQGGHYGKNGHRGGHRQMHNHRAIGSNHRGETQQVSARRQHPPLTQQQLQMIEHEAQELLARLKRENTYNPPNFEVPSKSARFFIIKSYSEDDVHRSIKYSIWCSTEHGNAKLDAAYRSQDTLGPVYLFFSVNGSGHFSGVAQMLSPVDYKASSGVWAQDKWKGQFKVKWIYVKDVSNSALKHIRLENNENKMVTYSRDTQEVPNSQGVKVLDIIHNYSHATSIFDDFLHYEKKQLEEQHYRKLNEAAAAAKQAEAQRRVEQTIEARPDNQNNNDVTTPATTTEASQSKGDILEGEKDNRSETTLSKESTQKYMYQRLDWAEQWD